MTEPIPKEYWAINSKDLLSGLGGSLTGLTSAEAQNRLVRNGANDFGASREPGALRLLLRQFESPLVLVLVFGAMLSFFLRCLVPAFDGAILSPEWRDALWDKFFTVAPQRRRQSVEQYKIVKRA